MAKAKKRKFAVKARIISTNDSRIAEGQKSSIWKNKVSKPAPKETEIVEKKKDLIEKPAIPSSMFLSYNSALGPPYQIIVDTNFINFSIQHKLDPMKAMLDCLLAKCVPCVTDCVVGELEKNGTQV
eukprot:GHVO01051215.1.p1 GENE.GHVO01051215.1~~GHVO01051215.1.p1  ORF type:complete len:137 (-),score=26.57 GHVO01051215.1:351-728(-)